MNTDDLIDALSKNLDPAPPARTSPRFALAALIGGVLALGLLLMFFGLRDRIDAHAPAVLAKALFSAALAAIAAPLALRLLTPGKPLGWRLGGLALGLAASGAIGLIAAFGADPQERFTVWMGGGFPWCLVIIPLLATPAAAGLMWLARDLAPTRLALAGGAIGGFAGGLGALVYAMYCPVDSVAFVATWYALAIALCAALGALIGSWVLRW